MDRTPWRRNNNLHVWLSGEVVSDGDPTWLDCMKLAPFHNIFGGHQSCLCFKSRVNPLVSHLLTSWNLLKLTRFSPISVKSQIIFSIACFILQCFQSVKTRTELKCAKHKYISLIHWMFLLELIQLETRETYLWLSNNYRQIWLPNLRICLIFQTLLSCLWTR